MSILGQTRTLHVRFDNWKWRKATVFDSDEKTELYRVECHIGKPQIITQSISENALSTKSKGEATFHSLSSRIDISLHGHNIELTSRGILKSGYIYASPALNGAKLTWQSKSKWGGLDLVCLDETAMPVAQTSFASWSMTKAGTIELTGGKVVTEGRGMDEVVLTALAMMQQQWTDYASAAS